MMTFLDHPLISRRIFHPRPTSIVPNLLVDVDEGRVGCYVHNWDKGAGSMLHFHGNGELAAEYSIDVADLFVGRGLNVCFAEYRGYGQSTGKPALVAMQKDGEKIVEELGVAPERIIAFGRSLGSLYAIELASRMPNIAGLILESGIASVLEDFPLTGEILVLKKTQAELVAEVNRYFDLQAKLKSYCGPLLVMHAQNDQFLDRSHAQRLHDWGGGQDKRLVIFPRGNHNNIMEANLMAYLREIEEFSRRVGIGLRRS